jgi:hypothetical protein
MMTLSPSRVSRRDEQDLSTVLDRVLGPSHRATVGELVASEMGEARASAQQMLFWMRVNMPTAASLVDQFLAGSPRR